MKKLLTLCALLALATPANAAQLTITIDGDKAALESFVDSYARAYGYTDTVMDAEGVEVNNPLSTLEFSAAPIGRHIGDVVKAYGANKAADAARKAALSAADTALEAVDLSVGITE